MLKNKKGIYILLPLVVFIWGAILYQVMDAFSDEPPLTTQTAPLKFSEISRVTREPFTIGEVSRDPFLGTVYRPKKKEVKKNTNIPQKTITWPAIRYKGRISGSSNNNAIYLVEINGVDQFLKKHQTVEGITFFRETQQGIRLKYKGQVKTFTQL